MLARQDGKKIGGVGMEVEITPRCTCLPPRQHCAEVAHGEKQVHLGYASVYLLSSPCNFSSSTPRPSSSTPRLRLGVLELGLGVLERSRWWAPRATSAQVPLVQVQVQLGYASVYLDLDSGYLSGVGQVYLPPLWYLYYNLDWC